MCNKVPKEWFCHCNSLAKTDLWATDIAMGGDGNEMSVVNHSPLPTHMSLENPRPSRVDAISFKTHMNASSPECSFCFPYSPQRICCNNQHTPTCIHTSQGFIFSCTRSCCRSFSTRYLPEGKAQADGGKPAREPKNSRSLFDHTVIEQ